MISGTILHYEILEKLGEGGMGVVYKAEDTRLRRLVALKFLPHDLNPTDEDFARFMREAQSAATLNHPNVCVVYAIEDAEDERFIVMEYIDGTTLRVKLQPGPLQIGDAVEYTLQIAGALAEAHDHGIVHQDVKSENIMVNSKNQIKVMDFGLARLRGVHAAGETNSTGGTLAYMSPEQVRGDVVDIQSDIWSLGIILYEMVTGRLPFFHGYEAATSYSILNSDPALPSELRPDIPDELEQIVLRCLRKNPGERYGSAAKCISDLRFLDHRTRPAPIAATVTGRHEVKTREGIERKQVTVIQGFITGFEEIAKVISEEDIPNALDNLKSILKSSLAKYEGILHKMSGGAFTAFFGLPDALENAPQKAINTALHIRLRLHEYGGTLGQGLNLGLRGSINTGPAIVRSLGADNGEEYSTVGEAIDVANRLLREAGENELVVGSSTFRYTRDEFRYRGLRPVVLEGKRDPVLAYLLLTEKEQKQKAEPGHGRAIYSEFVGRNEELDKLQFHLLKVINGQGGIVSIIADAGVGKSRLLAEFRKNDPVSRVALFEGRALSVGKNLGFHPIIDILRNWAGISEEDSDSQAYLKLEDSILRVLPENGAEIFPFVATMMGFALKGNAADRVHGITGDALNNLIQKSVRDLIIGGSELAPVVILIEDLHWADRSSIDLLQSLFRLAESQRVLFVITSRPGFAETSDFLLSSTRERYSTFYDEIHLKPLGHQEGRRLVENLLSVKDLPPKLVETIAKAEGNPFFIEEVLRSLIDDGVLVEEDGRFAFTEKVEAAVVPATIQDLLMSRIDKLDDRSRSLLKLASVMGRFFLYDLLCCVEDDQARVDDSLSHLKSVQLIRDSSRNRDREFVFVHALVQELVYSTLIAKAKSELHLKVAKAIESVYSERLSDFYGMLAFHYSAGGDLKKAEDYLFKAAEQTFNSAASYEAINYLKEAIEFYVKIYGEKADPDKLFVLERNLGLAYYNKGYWNDSLEHLKRALSYKGVLLEPGKLKETLQFGADLVAVLKDLYFPSKRIKKVPDEDTNSVFDVLYKIASVTANFDAKKMFFELLHMLRMQTRYQLQPKEGHASYAYASGIFSYSGLSFSLSRKFMQRASKYVIAGHLDSALKNSEHEVMLNFLNGDWKRIQDINEEYVNERLRNGDLYAATLAISWVIYVKNAQGDLQRSIELIHKQEDIGEEFDSGYARLFSSNFTLDRHLAKRDLRAAVKAADRTSDFAEQLGFESWLIGILAKKTKAQVLSGDLDGAAVSIKKAGDVMAKLDKSKLAPMLTCYYLTYHFWYLVELLERKLKARNEKLSTSEIRDLKKSALKASVRAMKISRKVADVRVETYFLMGRYAWLVGDRRKAFRYWRKSAEFGERLHALPDVGRIYCEVGSKMLADKLNRSDFLGLSGQDCLKKAVSIFHELELEHDLELIPH